MKTFSLLHRVLILALMGGLPAAYAQNAQPLVPPTIGAPQVLEIAPMAEPEPQPAAPHLQSSLPPPALAPLPETSPTAQARPENPVPSRRVYLGALYATAEEGQVGIKVLSVVANSPAARAGFQGADAPTSGQSDIVKAAIVVLAMSPAGAFAIPLAIAHDLYANRYTPGDLITAVDNQPVRDALEFNEALRRYKPGDSVLFSLTRAGKPLQLNVQLEEEPL